MKNKLFVLFLTVSVVFAGYGQNINDLKDAALRKLGVIKTENTFKGYFNLTDVGFLIGSTDNSQVAPFSFMTVNGYHITEQLSLGLGVGLEFPSGSYMPLVIDGRYYLRNESFSPFFSLYGGFALPLDDNGYYNYDYWLSSSVYYGDYYNLTAKGGWLINPGFGFRHMFSENFGVVFGIGYRFQRLYYSGDQDRQAILDLNRLSLKLGITFR